MCYFRHSLPHKTTHAKKQKAYKVLMYCYGSDDGRVFTSPSRGTRWFDEQCDEYSFLTDRNMIGIYSLKNLDDAKQYWSEQFYSVRDGAVLVELEISGVTFEYKEHAGHGVYAGFRSQHAKITKVIIGQSILNKKHRELYT